MKKFLTTFFIFNLTFFIFSQTFDVNFQLNTQKNDSKNHLNWTLTTKDEMKKTKLSIKDEFDAVSSASKKHSTKELRQVFFEQNGKTMLLPKGLYNLLLFAVSDEELIQKDNLIITQEEKKITIQFIHRGNAYKLQTDEKGYLKITEKRWLESDCKIASQIAENEKGIFSLKDEFILQEENSDKTLMKNADWEKLYLEDDKYDENASSIYAGKLKFTYRNGILRIKGKLKKKESIIEEPKPEPVQEEQTDEATENTDENTGGEEKVPATEQSEQEEEIKLPVPEQAEQEEDPAIERKRNRWKFNPDE